MSDSRITVCSGRAVVLRGHDIDTDRIIPARYLKAITFEGLERHLFVDDRAALTRAGQQHPLDRAGAPGASVLVVNKNFGCGSSREHAPQALYRWGIRVIIGESFSEIFFSNALMLGLPCVSIADSYVEALMAAIDADPEADVLVDIVASLVRVGSTTFPCALPPHARDAFTSGHWDGAGLLLERYDEVAAAEARLPY
jgi:3-isopropylmalate/(R)-2-methylmalate dehydratase small subunit